MSIVKTLKYILPVIATAIMAAGCAEEELYTPGLSDTENNYGVYFPSQTSPTQLDLDPSDETEVTYTVRRERGEEAITVPVVVEASEEGIFDIDPIVFGPGESETEFTVSFPTAERGVEYTCNIRIEDTRYISLYGTHSTTLSLSLIRAGWLPVTGPNGETKGKWRDNVIGNIYSIDVDGYNPYPEVEVEIYEREDLPGFYRMKVYGDALMQALVPGRQLSYTGRNLWTTIDASDPNKVYIPYQSIGITLVAEDGEMRIASNVSENFSMDESTSQYGTLEDGVITFPQQSVMCELSNNSGSFFYCNMQGMLRIMMPGVAEKDYSASLTSNECKDGVVEVSATIGADVEKFGYSIFEGSLDEGAASLQAQTLDESRDFDGTIDGTTAESPVTIKIENLEKTGKYTIIGCAYNDEDAMQTYAYANFGYVKKGESKPIILTIGLEATDEYAGQGINTDNSAKFYAYGSEIESLTYGLFRTSRLEGVDKEAALDSQGTKFTSEELEKLNDGHFSVMLKGLNGDSEYTLLVRASNGYATETKEAKIKTTGVFDPAMEIFYYDEFLPKDKQPSVEELINTEWDYYAVNYMDDEAVRRKIGTVTMTKNEEMSAESDVTFVNIKGMSGLEFESGGELIGAYMPDASMFADYVGALGIYVQTDLTRGIYQGEETTLGFIPDDFSGIYTQGYCMFMGAVQDGYLYCVGSPVAEEQGYNFMFLFTGTPNTIFSLLSEMMLVNPDKDVHNTSGAALSKIAEIKKAALSGFAPRNFVERPEFSRMPENWYASDSERMPVNLVYDPMPASAPALTKAKADIQVVPGKTGSNTGAIVRTGIEAKTL